MLSFTPVFLIFTSFIFLRELPTLFGVAGIILIVSGVYVMNANKGKRGLTAPFKEILRNKGVFYMLCVALLWSISINFDKKSILTSSPIFQAAIMYLSMGVAFLIILKFKGYDAARLYKNNFYKLLLVSGVLAFNAIVGNIAFSMHLVSYVTSVKRLSILFSVILGGIVFKEKSIMKRIICALIMIAGVIFIIFFG